MNIKNILGKAEALYHQGEHLASIDLCKKLLDKKPKLVQARQLLAINLQSSNQIEAAIKEFETALATAPHDAYLLSNFGNLYLSILEFKRAIPYLKRAIVSDPGFAAAYSNLALCYQHLGNTDAALDHYQKAILREGNSVEFHVNLGTLQLELGKFDLALNTLMKALEIDPSYGEIYFHIFSVMLYMHRYQDALEAADIGLLSEQLSHIQLCELLVGKATLFWLFDNIEEAHQAIQLSEGVYSDNSNYSNIKNLTVFHIYLKLLVQFRLKTPDFYKKNTDKPIYFISESHGFAPNAATVNHQGEEHFIKSLFIRGTKVFHLGAEKNNKFKESLHRLISGLDDNSKIILGFGEIDCRNNEGIFQHVVKTGADYRQVIDNMVSKYFNFLQLENSHKDHQLYVYGVPAPHPNAVESLSDADQELFINIIDYFNAALSAAAQENKMPFLDVYKLTSEGGVSNLRYHIDGFHLKPHTITDLFHNL